MSVQWKTCMQVALQHCSKMLQGLRCRGSVWKFSDLSEFKTYLDTKDFFWTWRVKETEEFNIVFSIMYFLVYQKTTYCRS